MRKPENGNRWPNVSPENDARALESKEKKKHQSKEYEETK